MIPAEREEIESDLVPLLVVDLSREPFHVRLCVILCFVSLITMYVGFSTSFVLLSANWIFGSSQLTLREANPLDPHQSSHRQTTYDYQPIIDPSVVNPPFSNDKASTPTTTAAANLKVSTNFNERVERPMYLSLK